MGLSPGIRGEGREWGQKRSCSSGERKSLVASSLGLSNFPQLLSPFLGKAMSLLRPYSHCNGQALAFTSYKGCSVRSLCLGPRGLPAPPLLSEVYLLPVSRHRQENLGVAAATPGLLSPYPSSGPQPHTPQSFLSQLKCSVLTVALPLEPSKALSSGPTLPATTTF